MIVSYDGRKFSGFQIQPNARTIQGELERAIEIATKEKVSCVASGRTDAKVSAYFQPVHFDIEKVLNKEKLLASLNGLLPKTIRVLSMAESSLHARFSAKRKTYLYKMYVSKIDLPLYADALKISPDLDFKSMKRFCTLIKGEHDFSGFKASGSEVESNTRTIYDATLRREGIYLYFEITGNGFLYKMVRNLVGTMLLVGGEKLDLKTLKHEIFSSFRSTFTAPAEFLYLLNVKYE